jgi:hypothetical protein
VQKLLLDQAWIQGQGEAHLAWAPSKLKNTFKHQVPALFPQILDPDWRHTYLDWNPWKSKWSLAQSMYVATDIIMYMATDIIIVLRLTIVIHSTNVIVHKPATKGYVWARNSRSI